MVGKRGKKEKGGKRVSCVLLRGGGGVRTGRPNSKTRAMRGEGKERVTFEGVEKGRFFFLEPRRAQLSPKRKIEQWRPVKGRENPFLGSLLSQTEGNLWENSVILERSSRRK